MQHGRLYNFLMSAATAVQTIWRKTGSRALSFFDKLLDEASKADYAEPSPNNATSPVGVLRDASRNMYNTLVGGNNATGTNATVQP